MMIIEVSEIPYIKFGLAALSAFTVPPISRKKESFPMYPVSRCE